MKKTLGRSGYFTFVLALAVADFAGAQQYEAPAGQASAQGVLLQQYDRLIRDQAAADSIASAQALHEQRRLVLLAAAVNPAGAAAVENIGKHAGKYGLDSGNLLRVQARDGKLAAAIGEGGPFTTLRSLGDGRYVAGAGAVAYSFFEDAEGRASDVLIAAAPQTARRIDPEQFTTIRIETSIAGDNRLILRGDKAQWISSRFAQPGRTDDIQLPTIVDGVEWTPAWYDFDGVLNKSGTRSGVFRLATPLPRVPEDVHCTLVRGRAAARVIRQPPPFIDDAIVIDFTDDAWEQDAYIVDIHFRSGALPVAALPRKAVPEAGLVAHYPFDGAADDVGGNGLHGVVTGIVPVDDRFGNAGGAVKFAEHRGMEILPGQRLAGGAIGISIWVQYHGFPMPGEWYPWSNTLVSQNKGPGAEQFELSTYRRFISWHRFRPLDSRLTATHFVTVDKWYHIVAQTDGVTHELYIDGVLADRAHSDFSFDPSMPIFVGRNGTDERCLFFNGAFDDLRLYDRSLAPAEVRALYDEREFEKRRPPLRAPRKVITHQRRSRFETLTTLSEQLLAGNEAVTIIPRNPLQAYAGDYLLDSGDQVQIREHDGFLVMRASSTSPAQRLHSVGDDCFVEPGGPAVFDFVFDTGETADAVKMHRVMDFGSALIGEPAYRIEARIDQRSTLLLRGTTARWINQSAGRAPGREPGLNLPTLINSRPWNPIFADAVDPQNKGVVASSTFAELARHIPRVPWAVRVVFPRNPGHARGAQLPDWHNDYSLVLDFNDDFPATTADYAVELYFDDEFAKSAAGLAWAADGERRRRIHMTIGPDPQSLPLADDGLVLHYPLDGDARELAGLGIDGSAVGVVAGRDRFGRDDHAVALKGTGGIDIMLPRELNGDALTLSVWIQHRGKVGAAYGGYILTQHGPTENFALTTHATHFVWRQYRGHNDQISISSVIKQHWTHLLLRYDGVTQEFFINGRLESSSQIPLRFSSQAPIMVGRDPSGKHGGFEGSLDDLRVYNRALRVEEILALYHDNGFDVTDPLIAALRADAPVAAIQHLAGKATSVNVVDYAGNSPLLFAAGRGDVDVLKSILARNPRHDANAAGNTPLMLAVRSGHVAAAMVLLDRDADAAIANDYGRQPLHAAAAIGSTSLVKRLLDDDYQIDALDWNGNSALHRAATYGHVAVARLLIENGIDVKLRNMDGFDACDLAGQMQQDAFVERLHGDVELTTAQLLGAATKQTEQRRVVARHVAKPPVPDGRITLGEYGGAMAGSGMAYAYTHQRVRDDTLFLVAYDARNLYVATVALQPAAKDLTLFAKAHDDVSMFNDHDHIELMLDTNHDRNSFYQVGWDYAGGKFDYAYHAPRQGRGWDPIWWVATVVEEDAFISEAVVPLAALGRTEPQAGEVWGFSIARLQSWKTGKQRHSIWADYLRGDFLKPGLWGELTFE